MDAQKRPGPGSEVANQDLRSSHTEERTQRFRLAPTHTVKEQLDTSGISMKTVCAMILKILLTF